MGISIPTLDDILGKLKLEGLPKAFQDQRDKASSLAELANTDMSTLDASGLDSLLTDTVEDVQGFVTDLRDQAKIAQTMIEGQKIPFTAEMNLAFNKGAFGPIALLAEKFGVPGPDGKPLDPLALQDQVNEAFTEGMNTVATIDIDVIKQQFTGDLKKLLPPNIPGIDDFVPGKKGGFNPFDAIGNIEIHQTINSITGDLEATVVELGKPSKVPAFNAAAEPASPTYERPPAESSEPYDWDAPFVEGELKPFPSIYDILDKVQDQGPTIEAGIEQANKDLANLPEQITSDLKNDPLVNALKAKRQELHDLLPQGSPPLPKLADVVDV